MSITDGKYVTGQEVRDEGVTATDADDAKVSLKIVQAERYIEQNTNRWFYKKQAATLTLDGGDSYYWLSGFEETTDTLMIPIPIITLTSVTIDGSLRTLSNFVPFTRIGPPVDDRWNPRIVSKYCEWPTQNVQNIVLVGDFGFCEDTSGTVPELIKIAARKLTVRFLTTKKMFGSDATARQMELNQGNIVEEHLPGYRYKLRAESLRKFNPVYVGDPEIDDIIDYYRYKRFVAAV